ncbi:MAG: peptide MFS transporter [Bacteroidetes bacterium]|nr:peptide MFS transporter [Bacteroidota bacterium]
MSEIQKGHPKGLYVLFITEMWERFSYYGMRAIFILFLVNALKFDKAEASSIYGSYTGLVYLTPLLGGFIADRFWGNRKSIIVGGFLMALGQFFMFLAGSFYEQTDFARILMLVGLFFLIFGNGFFKPNISTMVGSHYSKGDKRVDSAFTIFYMGINLGAFFSPLICGALGDTGDPADFKWGFLAACIGMLCALVLFIWLKIKYLVSPEGVQIGTKPEKKPAVIADINAAPSQELSKAQAGVWALIGISLVALFYFVVGFDFFGSLIFGMALAIPGLIISDRSLTKPEKDRIWVIYIAAFFVIFFWSAFEQAGASLTFFADEQTDRVLFGWTVPASYFQSINAVAIVICAPLFAALWTTLNKRNREPASPYKQAYGLALLSLGYLVIALGVNSIGAGEKSNMLWLIGLYVIHTFGELCLSPIGLSMVNKLAPIKFASLLMGVWFVANATANKFAGMLSGLYPEDVKIVQTYKAPEFPYTLIPAHDTVPARIENVKNDSAFIVNQFTESKDFYIKSFDIKAPEGPKLDSNLVLKAGVPYWNLDTVSVKNDKGKMEVHLTKMANSFASDTAAKIPLYKFKQIVKINLEKEKSPDVKKQAKIDTKWIASTDERRMRFSFVKGGGGKYFAVWSKGEITVYDLNPTKPKFAGVEITGLFRFFMLFVVLAGAASILLFAISGKMVKMMHGIR